MRRIGSNLQKRRAIMVLLTLVLMNTGCDERFDNPAVNPSEEKTVEVSMAIGFADEADACNLSASTKANANAKGKGAFDVELVPTATTRADASVKPDQLYRLEIRQYKQNGDCYTSSGQAPADQIIGERFSVSLTKDADCQLVFVAWGKNSLKSLGTVALSKAQEISIDAATINAIPSTDMSQMPYVLHLKHVNVTSDGKITNPDGVDVRILLKRLATRLNISWDYKVSGYKLNQIILQSIPRNYKVVPAPDEKSMNTYPSVMDQYMDIQLTDDQVSAAGKSYSCWVPANVRGINTVSNGPQYRIKENAPVGSSYISFIAANASEGKKKLNYRIYLGGKDYSDFNLNENTDYSYKINFKHTGLPVDDKRVTIIDPIPASENNENFVPTANCFMAAPGGAFCFNPYKYYVNGSISENELLKEWCASNKIQSVKVLWQTKENGDVGDPVLGVVNSSTDHTNIVDLTDGGDFEKARIYCRVAPNTIGGNGVIIAYASADGTGSALWSWHIWVTDYAPDATGNETILTANKRKLKFLYNVGKEGQLPMMDRNLGAMAGYVNEIPASPLDKSKTNGFHYQWGRKDPFPSSFSNENITEITDFSGDVPVKGMLNRYKADGITYFPNINGSTKTTSLKKAYENPNIRYCIGSSEWCSDSNKGSLWGSTKTVNDPCPAGWKVAAPNNYAAFLGQDYTSPGSDGGANWLNNLVNTDTNKDDGGILVYYEKKGAGNSVYLRYTGYPAQTAFGTIGRRVALRSSTATVCFVALRNESDNGFQNYNITSGWWNQDSHTLRCIQEKE